jgi:hypothetical protein
MADQSSSTGYKFEKLNHDNYATWVTYMTCQLRKEKLWDSMNLPAEAEPPDTASELDKVAWKTREMERNAKQVEALASITFGCQPSQLFLVKGCQTGIEAWNAIQQHHLRPTMGAKTRLMQRLMNAKPNQERDLRDHVHIVWGIFDHLQALGVTLDPAIAIGIVFASIKHLYTNLVTAMEAWPEERLTLKEIRNTLLEEYDKEKALRVKKSINALRAEVQQKKKELQEAEYESNETRPRGSAENNSNAQRATYSKGSRPKGKPFEWVTAEGYVCHQPPPSPPNPPPPPPPPSPSNQRKYPIRTTRTPLDRLVFKAEESNVEPKTFKQAMKSSNAHQWKMAMDEEIKAIEDNMTWELADLPPGRKAIGCKWVFKEKKDGSGTTIRYKARLVAQGFSQKFGQDYDEVFAPVARQATFRLLLSIAGTRNYHLRQYDIKSAFLNGKLEEEIYMKQPPGYEHGEKIYRLRKSLYGLKQSARVWNQTLHNTLEALGCRQNQTDNCLYVWKHGNNVCYILIHVDDLLVAGNNKESTIRLMEAVGKKFELTNLGGASHFLGIDIEKDSEGRFMISQTGYIDSIIVAAGLENANKSKFPLDTGYDKLLGTPLESNEEYRKLIGMLLYLSTNTRPDIAASVAILSKKVEHPRDCDMTEVKRVIKYLSGTRNLKLLMNEPGGDNNIVVYSDANWAEDTVDRKSNTGYYVSLNGGTISWCCRKQDLVALSSAESEYIALAETCKEVLWLREMMKGLDIKTSESTTILTDSQSCIAMLRNQRFSHRTKHFDTRYHFIRDHVAKGDIKLEYVPTAENTADLMTKPLGGVKTEYLRRKAGLIGGT